MIRSIFLQVVLFASVFWILSWFKTIGMLETNQTLESDLKVTKLYSEQPLSLNASGKKKILYFFAPWCQVCHLSIGNLQSQFEKNDDIDVIAIALDYVDTNEVVEFVKDHNLTIDIGLGNEATKNSFKISGYPSYYVLDEDNTVIKRSIGYSSELGLYLGTL